MNWYLYMTRKRSSFVFGIGRTMDIFSVIKAPYENLPAGRLSGFPDDGEALYGDWIMVGQDMKVALELAASNDQLR